MSRTLVLRKVSPMSDSQVEKCRKKTYREIMLDENIDALFSEDELESYPEEAKGMYSKIVTLDGKKLCVANGENLLPYSSGLIARSIESAIEEELHIKYKIGTYVDVTALSGEFGMTRISFPADQPDGKERSVNFKIPPKEENACLIYYNDQRVSFFE